MCPCRLGGRRFKKYSTKTANTLISLFADGAVKLSPLIPRFPSRLIKEEIAPEEAVMTKGLLISQRPLYRAHILRKNTPKVSTPNSLSQLKMNQWWPTRDTDNPRLCVAWGLEESLCNSTTLKKKIKSQFLKNTLRVRDSYIPDEQSCSYTWWING